MEAFTIALGISNVTVFILTKHDLTTRSLNTNPGYIYLRWCSWENKSECLLRVRGCVGLLT